MKRLIYGLSLFCAAMITTIAASGQQVPQSKGMLIKSEDSFLEPLQKRNSALIGDQFRYGFHLKDVAEGTRFALPDFSKGFIGQRGDRSAFHGGHGQGPGQKE